MSAAAFSRDLFAGIPQHGTQLGNPSAPVPLVEFADLQCPYCDDYAVQALPMLVKDYVRTGKLQMEFEDLSFIGPDSVKAAPVAAAASQQNRLWNFVDLLYLNQGTENTGYVTAAYLRRLLDAVPGLNVPLALHASETPAAGAAQLTLSGAGIGIAAYLTYVHYAGLHPVCGISHGCETVQTSSYASLAGLPVALLGLVTYVLILGTLCWQGENAFLAGYILTLVGFGFSVYLTYRDVFTIHAICSWCVSSAIVLTLLAVAGTLRARRLSRAFLAAGARTPA